MNNVAFQGASRFALFGGGDWGAVEGEGVERVGRPPTLPTMALYFYERELLHNRAAPVQKSSPSKVSFYFPGR
jgi:hypothetical protein